MPDARPNVRLDLTEIGTTGLKRTGGWINEEFLTQLSGTRKNKIYTEMWYNDPVIAGVLFAIEMLIRQAPWSVKPSSVSAPDTELARFVDSALHDMESTLEDTISEILTMLPYGFAPLECVYKYRRGPSKNGRYNSRYSDGKLAWRKLALRAQDTIDRWEFTEAGDVKGLWQYIDTGGTVYIPMDKVLLFRTSTAKGNPEGLSILRKAYTSFYVKKHLQQIEAIGIERDLTGIPMALVPSEILANGATTEATTMLNNMRDIVRNVRRDEQEGLVLPSDRDEQGHLLYEFKLLTTGGSRQINIDPVIARYDQRIAMTCLADFLLLGHEKVGSFALSATKTHLFSVALGAWLDSIAAVFNRYAIPRLLELNGIRTENPPQLVHGDVEDIDIEALGAFIQKISNAGMPLFPDDGLENFLREAAHLPKKPEDGDLQIPIPPTKNPPADEPAKPEPSPVEE